LFLVVLKLFWIVLQHYVNLPFVDEDKKEMKRWVEEVEGVLPKTYFVFMLIPFLSVNCLITKILCNQLGFKISGRTGSHVRLSKMTPGGKVGTVVPMHKELKIGTLKGVGSQIGKS
jgi:predicted RNA binding protein YcfA (HicA-like mRNA interferase family)